MLALEWSSYFCRDSQLYTSTCPVLSSIKVSKVSAQAVDFHVCILAGYPKLGGLRDHLSNLPTKNLKYFYRKQNQHVIINNTWHYPTGNYKVLCVPNWILQKSWRQPVTIELTTSTLDSKTHGVSGPRTLHLELRYAVIFYTQSNFSLQLHQFFQQFFTWATIFSPTFIRKILAVSCVV
mgnify:CR=1 FL=1